MAIERIYLATDHAGCSLKEAVRLFLEAGAYAFDDLGTHSEESVNYAQFGARAAARVAADPLRRRAILFCGTGIGMSIVANKFKNVRAALCRDEADARMSRLHNDANVLCLAGRVTSPEMALKIVHIFLNTDFEGGRHQLRLDYITNVVEAENFR